MSKPSYSVQLKAYLDEHASDSSFEWHCDSGHTADGKGWNTATILLGGARIGPSPSFPSKREAKEWAAKNTLPCIREMLRRSPRPVTSHTWAQYCREADMYWQYYISQYQATQAMGYGQGWSHPAQPSQPGNSAASPQRTDGQAASGSTSSTRHSGR